MRASVVLVACVGVLLACAAAVGASKAFTPTLRRGLASTSGTMPQQVTVAVSGANADGAAVSFETVDAVQATVAWGLSKDSLTNKVAASTTTYSMFSYTSNFIHHAVLPSLGNNQRIFYTISTVGSDGASSATQVFNFTTVPAPGDMAPLLVAIVGDLGQTKYSLDTLEHVMATPGLQALMLAGDLSYADLDEQRWVSWGTMVQPSTASLPWMFAPGNHEIEDATGLCPVVACGPLTGDCYEDFDCHAAEEYCENAAGCGGNWTCKAACLTKAAGSSTLTQQLAKCFTTAVATCAKDGSDVPPKFLSYDTRFLMPWKESGASSNQWYSWQTGPMHVTVLNSYAPFTAGTPQYNWLQADLAAVDRSVTPWLFVVFHCPWYNSDVAHHGEGDAMKAALEETLYNAKVAMVFNGHVHAYERSVPVYKNTPTTGAPTYIVIGDGGNREGLATSYYPQPSWSAFRQANYGHGQLLVANATMAHFQWHRDIDNESTVTDEVWVTNPWQSS